MKRIGLLVGLVLLTGCKDTAKKEFDPVQSFKGHVQQFRTDYEAKFPESCAFVWATDDINVETTSSLTKPYYGEGITMTVAFDSFRNKSGKDWTASQLRTMKNRKNGKTIKSECSLELGWFYSKNDNRWHLSKTACDCATPGVTSAWIDPISKDAFDIITVAIDLDDPT